MNSSHRASNDLGETGDAPLLRHETPWGRRPAEERRPADEPALRAAPSNWRGCGYHRPWRAIRPLPKQA
jgi:hypothetical protein